MAEWRPAVAFAERIAAGQRGIDLALRAPVVMRYGL
jgi:hypothetical protein